MRGMSCQKDMLVELCRGRYSADNTLLKLLLFKLCFSRSYVATRFIRKSKPREPDTNRLGAGSLGRQNISLLQLLMDGSFPWRLSDRIKPTINVRSIMSTLLLSLNRDVRKAHI